ncbi:hypothetical protein M885DRAFT_618834 [Pelagophyceae sp. CCMP2097]|nr:hypothetical protein M885DRAFT_618834 [Pelagophyceae sp. CCMP2097]
MRFVTMLAARLVSPLGPRVSRRGALLRRFASSNGIELLSLRRAADGTETFTVTVDGERGEMVQGKGGWAVAERAWDAGDPLAAALPADYAFDATGAPKWPKEVRSALQRSPLKGVGTICFDGARFAELIADEEAWPVVFPNAAKILALPKLLRLEAQWKAIASEDFSLRKKLKAVLPHLLWRDGGGGDGSGRLIGDLASGELAQVADGSFWNQLGAALGDGSLTATFYAKDDTMGLAFAPVTPDERGAEVGPVDAGSAAEREGCAEGMTLRSVNGIDVLRKDFEDILEAIDVARASPRRVELKFETAVAASRYYAVELPVAALPALAGEADDDIDVGTEFFAALDGLTSRREEFIWREQAPRAFIGDAASMTCLHVDMLPQLQFAHGLGGTKLLGVATLAATARLSKDHCVTEDETRVPTHAKLDELQRALLLDADVSVAVLRPGDALVFSSAAAHFASNGASGPNAAIYHGALPKGKAEEFLQSDGYVPLEPEPDEGDDAGDGGDAGDDGSVVIVNV